MRSLALVVCLVACGGGGSSKDSTTPAGTAPASTPAIAAGAPYGAADEAIGGLSLGMPQERALEVTGPLPAEVPPAEEMAATGEWVFAVAWPAQGLTVTFAATQQAGPFTVGSIATETPNSWVTPRGIGIGSTKADVERVYAGALTTEGANPNSVVVNSVYGGLIFSIANDKVDSIFIGAAAE